MANVGFGVNTGGQYIALPETKLPVYSAVIERLALPNMPFDYFAVQNEDLSKMPGEQIIFTRFGDIDLGGPLLETKTIETKAFTASQYSVTVTEWGNGMEVSEKRLHLAQEDTLMEASISLGRDYGMTTNKWLRDTVMGTPNVIYSNGRASRAALQGGVDYFNIDLVHQAAETLDTAGAPKFQGLNAWVCVCHPHHIAYLRQDPHWEAVQLYNRTGRPMDYTVGRIDDMVFISSTGMPNGAQANTGKNKIAYDATLINASVGGTAPANVYKSVFFGDYCYVRATALPVQLRYDIPADFGRQHKLAWYGIFGLGLMEADFAVVAETV